MKRIDQLFKVHRAKSGLFVDYAPGEVAYIGNGLVDNAVTGFVTPMPNDRVFRFTGIAVSAFCEATIQVPPYVACGRAGNGLTVLQPLAPMPTAQLAYIAAYVNSSVRWRFNWYRQTTADRIKSLLIPDQMPPTGIHFDVGAELPPLEPARQPHSWTLALAPFAVGDLYSLAAGDYHSLAALGPGRVPVVSCGDSDNGISAYCNVRNRIHQNKLTIAFNGMNTLTAKYHPYQFAAKDDVAVCTPKQPMRLSTELCVQAMLNRERWRYSYYRKCFIDKLERVQILLPAKGGKPDEEVIAKIVEATPYWGFLSRCVERPTN